jgi:hypothetical protein
MFYNSTSTRQPTLFFPSDISVAETLAISQEDFEASASLEIDSVIGLHGGEVIAGAHAQSYEILQQDTGHEISVQIETKDGNGFVEVVQSASVSVPISSELQTEDGGRTQPSSKAGIAISGQVDNAVIVFETTQVQDPMLSTRAVFDSMIEPMYYLSDERASQEFNLDGSKISGVTLSFEDQAGIQSKSITNGTVDLSASTIISGLKIAENAYEADVSINDVIQNLRHIVGLETLTGKAAHAGDADNDGSIGISDVIVQLRHIVGLADIDTFDIIDSNDNLVTDLRNATPSLDLVLNGDVDLSTELKADYIHTNYAPNFPILSASYVEENAEGQIIGDVSSIDLDGDNVTFSLASGGDNSHFELIGDKLKLLDAHSADFEDKNTYSITVIVSDGIASAEKTFEIAVVNKLDAPGDALAQLNIKYIDERIFDQYTSSLETVDAQFKELDKSVSTQLNNFNSYVDLHQENASLTVSSKGFTIDYGDYELVANFATFSPNSLSELQQLQNIDAQDSSTWIIDGGFSDIVIKNTSGDLVKLMLDSDGLSLTSETVSTGDLSGIRLDGTFSNQVSDLLTFTDYYSKIDSTSGNTAVSHIDDLRAFANGKFELTGISLLREGATDVAASVNYGNDTLTLSLEKFELSASVQNLSDVVDFTSLELRDNYFNSSVIDLFDDISGDSTSASLILNHDDHGSLLNLQIEDLNKLENVTIGSSNTFGMLDGNHYAVDENFTLATYVDFGDKVLDTSAFTSYFNNLDELSDIYTARIAPGDALAQLNIKYIDERIFDQYTSSLETVDAQFKELDKSVSTQLNNFNSYVDLHQENASLTVSSKGFTVDYGDYELVANFATFSPNSLSELQQLQNIDARDSSTWVIDGGFSDIVIKNTSGDLVKLMLDSDGLLLTSETVSTGDLSGIRLDGTFQIRYRIC